MIGGMFPVAVSTRIPDDGRRSTVQLLIAMAAKQHGMFTTEQALGVGLSRWTLDRLVDEALIVRERRGAYRIAGVEAGNLQRYQLAAMTTRGTISHDSAPLLWGYTKFPETPVHVTVARNGRNRSGRGLVVHSTERAIADLGVIRSGLPVTRPFRTLLDLAGGPMEDGLLQGFLDHCIAERHFLFQTFRKFVEQGAAKNPGAHRLRQFVGAAAMIDSVVEGEVLRLLAEAGIELPVTGLNIYDNGHFIGRADFAWETPRVVLEMDGYAYHSSYRAFVADRQRANRLSAAGWEVIRVTPEMVRNDPGAVCAAIIAALERAASRRLPA
jgi:hypothetical protein